MPEQTFTQLFSVLNAKALSVSALSPVYLIIGSDDSLKREASTKLQALALDPDFADFDRETVDLGAGANVPDGEADPVLRILSGASMAPFMSPRRVVVVTSVQRLPKERQNSLAAGLKKLGDLSLLLLIADTPEFEAGRPKGRQLEASFKKAVATAGVVVNCDAPQVSDLKARAQALFSDWGKRSESGVLDAIAEHASAIAANSGGGAVATMTRECEKLRAYVGESDTITRADVDELMPDVAEDNIFKLLDAVGTRNIKQSMDCVDAMLSSGDKPDGVALRTMVMLQRHVRLLMLGKFAAEKKIDTRAGVPAEIKDILSNELGLTLTGQAYRMPNYIRQASKFTWDELIWATSRILATDLAMKGIVPPASLGASSPARGDDSANSLRATGGAALQWDEVGQRPKAPKLDAPELKE